jgi:hypothetical protein
VSGLLGAGALAIWHDIAPEGRDTFYAWHGQQHMPERLAIPGFLRGRRYVGIDARLEFFNLYETQDLEVLLGAAYTARVNHPTPWTLEAVRHFRAVSRSLCRVGASVGHAQGGLMATLRYDVAASQAYSHGSTLGEQLLPAWLQQPGIAGVHLLRADAQASGEANAEQRARGAANAVPRWVLLLEGWGDERAFVAQARMLLTPAALEPLGGVGPFDLDLYRHQITCLGTAQ